MRMYMIGVCIHIYNLLVDACAVRFLSFMCSNIKFPKYMFDECVRGCSRQSLYELEELEAECRLVGVGQSTVESVEFTAVDS